MKKNSLSYLIIIFMLFCNSGCVLYMKSKQPVPLPCSESEPSIRILKTTKTDKGFLSITFPAGIYTPAFQSSDGTYYQAPSSLIFDNDAKSGGIFIPFRHNKDQKMSGWFDNPKSEIGHTSATLMSKFEPIQYETIKR
jgi:hypothetical protein